MTLPVPIRFGSTNPDLLVGLATAHGVRIAEAPTALTSELDALIAERGAGEGTPEAVRTGIRDLLRHGGFKPTGRNKPASEYLAKAAVEGRFPRINNVVDVCNLVSLGSGFPVSLVDLDLALEGGAGLVLREAVADESFVFNPSGQTIDLHGLLCLAREDGAPIANAVKDSMATKTHDGTRAVLAVLYAAKGLATREEVDGLARRMADGLGAHGEAEAVEAWTLTPEDGTR